MEWDNKEKKTPLVWTSDASARWNISKAGSQGMWENYKNASRKTTWESESKLQDIETLTSDRLCAVFWLTKALYVNYHDVTSVTDDEWAYEKCSKFRISFIFQYDIRKCKYFTTKRNKPRLRLILYLLIGRKIGDANGYPVEFYLAS